MTLLQPGELYRLPSGTIVEMLATHEGFWKSDFKADGLGILMRNEVFVVLETKWIYGYTALIAKIIAAPSKRMGWIKVPSHVETP